MAARWHCSHIQKDKQNGPILLEATGWRYFTFSVFIVHIDFDAGVEEIFHEIFKTGFISILYIKCGMSNPIAQFGTNFGLSIVK